MLAAFTVPVIGEKAFDLMTVAPGTDKGGRPRKGEETGATVAPVSDGPSDRKAKNLRAILRAPEVVQNLYRDGLIAQTVAAKLGPKSPGPGGGKNLSLHHPSTTRPMAHFTGR